MIELSIAHQRVNKQFAFAVGGEVALSGNAKAVESTTKRQTFEGLAVDLRKVHSVCKIENVLIQSMGLSLLDDGSCSGIAHALDGSKTKAYFPLVVHAKLLIALVNIGP